MFSMPSQDTFGKVRLNEKVESRVRGDLLARFGGECLETYRAKTRKGAGCLAYGQIASPKIPFSRMISPSLYWIMSGDDFTLDINNLDEPKVLCWATTRTGRTSIRRPGGCTTPVSSRW